MQTWSYLYSRLGATGWFIENNVKGRVQKTENLLSETTNKAQHIIIPLEMNVMINQSEFGEGYVKNQAHNQAWFHLKSSLQRRLLPQVLWWGEMLPQNSCLQKVGGGERHFSSNPHMQEKSAVL